MLQGLIKHSLTNCVDGWSPLAATGHTLDITKVVDVVYRRRLFCIFDQGYPYNLEITYKEPVSASMVTPRGAGTVAYLSRLGTPSHPDTQIVTARYPSEAAIKAEIEAIRSKQHHLDRVSVLSGMLCQRGLNL